MKDYGIAKHLVFLGVVFSCSSFKKGEYAIPQKFKRPVYSKTYELVDKAGRFSVHREVGKSKKDRDYVVKKRVYSQDEKRGVIERSIAIATPGRLKNINILRPKIAQYVVFFNKEKYFSELKLDIKNKSMLLRVESPEEQWNGVQKIPFPRGTGVFCFFSMIVECAASTGFIEKAIQKGNGKMRFHIIWDGYPYMQEQYRYLPDKIFSPAELVFEGNSESGDKKFSLFTEGQTIFYVVQPEGILKKIFWISEGMSMVEMGKGGKPL